MALYLMVFMGGTPLGSPLVGWVGETFGARWSLIGGGLMSILGTLLCVALYVRARRRPGGRASSRERRARRCLDSSGEPPLPAPGDPGRPGPADRDRRDQLRASVAEPLAAGPRRGSRALLARRGAAGARGGRRAGSAAPQPRWRRVELRYVDLKAGRHLQVTSFDATQAFTANHRGDDAAARRRRAAGRAVRQLARRDRRPSTCSCG